MGDYTLERLRALNHPLIGEVRGAGLFLGIEFVYDDNAPAPQFTTAVVEEMRRRGVLLGKLGRWENVLKIRPPMPFSRENADQLADTLTAALAAVDV